MKTCFFRKKPLDSDLDHRSRRRRVNEKRKVLLRWAEEEGVSATTLLGYLIYLENSHGDGDQNLSDIGWKIFMGESWRGIPSASLEEAIWLVERSGMSQAVYLEARLRFKDRFYLPPVMHLRAENQRHRPTFNSRKTCGESPVRAMSVSHSH